MVNNGFHVKSSKSTKFVSITSCREATKPLPEPNAKSRYAQQIGKYL